MSVYLFLCPEPPSSNENNWEGEGCVLKRSRTYHVTPPYDVDTVRYSSDPDLGDPSAHGTGWWIGCTISRLTNQNFDTIWGPVMKAGNRRYIDVP
jgi:hypothetical protein